MTKMFSPLINDGYKIGHVRQYPEGTTMVYSNFTPRTMSRSPIPPQVAHLTNMTDKLVVAGVQILLKKYLKEGWDETFFSRDHDEVVGEYREFVETFQGVTDFDVSHISDLHKLGYLPLHVKALPEGIISNTKIPMLTIRNTDPRFGWLVGFLEDLISNTLWKITTIATISHTFRRLLENYYDETGLTDKGFINFQCHDFSLRGMSGPEDAMFNNIGHLFSFMSSDCLPAIYMARHLYNQPGFIAGGVPATEHSVMSSYGKDNEKECIEHLINLYPSGILSVVSDTYDYWNMVTPGGILSQLKDKIVARDGKYVVRPDSGDPADIICGTVKVVVDRLPTDPWDNSIPRGLRMDIADNGVFYNREDGKYYMYVNDRVSFVEVAATPEMKGTIECLWDTFGGTVNDEGYQELSEKIGVIYGDAITLERCKDILDRLKAKGFAANNMVFGVGSYTMQYMTRDSFGFAMKSTYSIVNGEPRNLIKDPKTGDGTKKSASGLLCVHPGEQGLELMENCTAEEEAGGLLRDVFIDGDIKVDESLEVIRHRLAAYSDIINQQLLMM